jgi:hypothetical protein
VANETRDETIARMERDGMLDPTCPGCRERYEAANPLDVFAPRHKASANCESGKRAHCSCDRCW